MRKKVEVNVRGQKRTVYLGESVGKNKWKAQIYFYSPDLGYRTSVAGTFQRYSNGTQRFTPSENALNKELV